jgi:hypothetical protein
MIARRCCTVHVMNPYEHFAQLNPQFCRNGSHNHLELVETGLHPTPELFNLVLDSLVDVFCDSLLETFHLLFHTCWNFVSVNARVAMFVEFIMLD